MPTTHHSPAIYERIEALYVRNSTRLISMRYYHGLKFDVDFKAAKETYHSEHYELEFDARYGWEIERDNSRVGVIMSSTSLSSFDHWFLSLILSTTNVHFEYDLVEDEVASQIADLYEAHLKNTGLNDQWNVGREYFVEVILYFTRLRKTVHAVLPAFPCKSSNPQKVSGSLPDKGEKLALQRLVDFTVRVKEIYEPGMKITIVSDGHVFSDCIGVDDTQVDTYSAALKSMYQSLGSGDAISFKSLVDIFNPDDFDLDMGAIELPHYLETTLDARSELCRQIMMKSCDTDYGKLRREITTPNHPRLALFRGFSRFMLEDLIVHPRVSNMTKTKMKKVASKVAFEMIKRNDAYSNLVELVFPFDLRLSIHCHDNSGPKFAVRLLNDCRVIESINDFNYPQTADLLHVPTPWHNSIVKFEGTGGYFVVKRSKIDEGVDQGKGTASWNAEGFFSFKLV